MRQLKPPQPPQFEGAYGRQLSCSVVHEHHIFSGHPPRWVDAFSLFLLSPRIVPRSVRGPLVLLPEVVGNSWPPPAGRYKQHGSAPAVTVPATAAGANTATGTAESRFAWMSPFHSPTPACRSVALYSYRWWKSGLRALLLFLLVVAATGRLSEAVAQPRSLTWWAGPPLTASSPACTRRAAAHTGQPSVRTSGRTRSAAGSSVLCTGVTPSSVRHAYRLEPPSHRPDPRLASRKSYLPG